MNHNLVERIREFRPFSTNVRFVAAAEQAEQRFPEKNNEIDNIAFDTLEDGFWNAIILGTLFSLGTLVVLSGIKDADFLRFLAVSTVGVLTELCSLEVSCNKGLEQLKNLGEPRQTKVYHEI